MGKKNLSKLQRITKEITVRTKSGKIIKKNNTYWVDPNKKKGKKNLPHQLTLPVSPNQSTKKPITYRVHTSYGLVKTASSPEEAFRIAEQASREREKSKENRKTLESIISNNNDYVTELFLLFHELHDSYKHKLMPNQLKMLTGFDELDINVGDSVMEKISKWKSIHNWQINDKRGYEDFINHARNSLLKKIDRAYAVVNILRKYPFFIPNSVFSKKVIDSYEKIIKELYPISDEFAVGKSKQLKKEKKVWSMKELVDSVQKDPVWGLQLLHTYKSIIGDKDLRIWYDWQTGGMLDAHKGNIDKINKLIEEFENHGVTIDLAHNVNDLVKQMDFVLSGILNVNSLFGPGANKFESEMFRLSNLNRVAKSNVSGVVNKERMKEVSEFYGQEELIKDKNFMNVLKYLDNPSKFSLNLNNENEFDEFFKQMKSFIKHLIDNGGKFSKINLDPQKLVILLGRAIDFNRISSHKIGKTYDLFSGIDQSKKIDSFYGLDLLVMADLRTNSNFSSDRGFIYGNMSADDFGKYVDKIYKDKLSPRSIAAKGAYLISTSSLLKSFADDAYHDKEVQRVSSLNLPEFSKIWETHLGETTQLSSAGVIFFAHESFGKLGSTTDARLGTALLGRILDHDVAYRQNSVIQSKLGKMMKDRGSVHGFIGDLYYESSHPALWGRVAERLGIDSNVDFRANSDFIIKDWINGSRRKNSLLVRRSAEKILGFENRGNFTWVPGDKFYNFNLGTLDSNKNLNGFSESLKKIYAETQNFLHLKSDLYGIKKVAGRNVFGFPLYRKSLFIYGGGSSNLSNKKLFVAGGTLSVTTSPDRRTSAYYSGKSIYDEVHLDSDSLSKHGFRVYFQENYADVMEAFYTSDRIDDGFMIRLNKVPVKNIVLFMDKESSKFYKDRGLYSGPTFSYENILLYV